MTTPRKTYTPAFKAALVEELLSSEQSATQIASRHGVHPNMLRRWRDQAVAALPTNFEDDDRLKKQLEVQRQQYEAQTLKLYAQIGKLTTELDWLKKKYAQTGFPPRPPGTGRAGGRKTESTE
jgi:transposase